MDKVKEKELIELFEAAKKAADAAASASASDVEESRCLDALKQLLHFPVNYHLLLSTQVGKRLRSLTKHPRNKIHKLASDLIQLWKSIIVEETTNKKPTQALRNQNVKVDKTDLKLSNIQTAPAESKFECGNAVKIASKFESDNAVKVERILKQDEVGSIVKKPAANVPPKLTSMIKCNDASRDKIRQLLLENLTKVCREADESMRAEVDACDPIRVAISVESVMFEKWGGNTGAHKARYRSIMFNLKDANNPDFRRKVLLGQIQPDRIVNLTPAEMASDQRQIENQQIKKKMLFDCERGGPPKATTDQFKCGRCGQRKCTYYQLQTRSADEPMTTFVTCVNCNNHWKFC